MQPQVKQRNSNLELYRIIVMLLIVAHHYVVNSGMMEEMAKDPLSSRSIFYYIFGMWGKIGISIKEFCYTLVPMRQIAGNFTGCFMWFYLCIPFLTVLVSHLDKKQHRLLVLLCMAIYTMCSTLPGFEVTMNHVSWYSVLFFIASYIRFYGLLPRASTAIWGAYLYY